MRVCNMCTCVLEVLMSICIMFIDVHVHVMTVTLCNTCTCMYYNYGDLHGYESMNVM